MPSPWSTISSADEAGPFEEAGGPVVVAIHTAIPGRARYRVKGLYRCDRLKRFLEGAPGRDPAIISISANIITGNMLVHYQEEFSLREVASLLESYLARYDYWTPAPVAAAPAERRREKEDRAGRRAVRMLARLAKPQEEQGWHLMEAEDVAATLESSATAGLPERALPERLNRYGPNLLAESVPRSSLSILVGQLNSLPVYLLTASAFLSLFTGGLADAVVIMAVVAINAAVGFVTESRAETTINSLKRLGRPTALVLRDGAVRETAGDQIVPGDLLLLRRGSYVAADCRIVESQHLSVDEAALTGESLPAVKHPFPLKEEHVPLADRANMAYMGTLVTGGQGLALVVGTGRFTEMGRVQSLVGEAQAPKTPMEKQLEEVANRLVLYSAAVCGVVFLAGVARGYPLLQMLRSAISLAVAAIPEGLPAVATTILALGVQDMKRHKVLIRHLVAVETLGSVQTVCLDKTGTLTHNRMMAVEIRTAGRKVTVREGRLLDGEEPLGPAASEEVRRLLEVCALCSEAEAEDAGGGWTVHGSATESALVRLALDAGIDVNRLRQDYPLIRLTHRSESRNYMVSVHQAAAPGDSTATAGYRLVAIKGSPNEVLSLCRRCMKEGAVHPLTDEDRLAIELANERMAGASLRVLAAAFSRIDGAGGERSLTWLGLVGMTDPLKPGMQELMERFHRAGMETLMITGDQVATAYAIGSELKLSRDNPLEIFDSSRMEEMDPDLLSSFAQKVHVFARVSPAQKLRIVQALQRGGRVVAMTGDGINDSPALKAADIGIAMGRSGTDVAREVADVVLEDDDLNTMITAIGHGRTTYRNIRKSLRFLLATNLSEIMVMFVAIAVGLGQPLSAMQLLWINLISDICPSLALAMEGAEPDVLETPPRDPQQPIVSDADQRRIAREGGVISAGAMAAYAYGVVRHGAGARAGGIAFMSLTSAQLLHAISCRSDAVGIFHEERLPANRYLLWALGGSFALQGLTLLLPGLRRLLGVTALGFGDAVVVGGTALVPLIINEASKKERE